jgi:hypothetical protein
MFLSYSEDCYREQGVHFGVQRRGRRGALILLASSMGSRGFVDMEP